MTLVYPGKGWAGYSSPPMAVGKPLSFGGLIVCLDRPGTITVDRVSLFGAPRGLRVVGFAVRPNPMLSGKPALGAEERGLAGLGFGSDRRVTVPCSVRVASELAVEVVRSAANTVSAPALEAHYRSGGVSKTLHIPYGITMCALGEAPTVHCP